MNDLPIELLSCIFDRTNKQDQLACQLVCYRWHVPAKRAFYSKITIEEKHDDLNFNNLFRFKKFIECISSGEYLPLPTPGQFIQSLVIRYEIALETKFMPTNADFQHLAAACPNLQELQFPSNMFWNNVMSIDNQQYWKRLRKVPQFKVMADKQSLDKFLYFKSSLSYLHITEWQSSKQHFIDMIKSFTHLETLKITTRHGFTSLYDIIPTLIECPNITQLIMTSNTTSTTTHNAALVPKLRQLKLTSNTLSPQLVHTITHQFPQLQKLMLHFSQPTNDVFVWSDDLQTAMAHMIRFLTCLHQARIDLFVPNYAIMHQLVRQFYYAKTGPKLYISYGSCSSFTTGQPDLVYHKQEAASSQQAGILSLRYQGHLPAGMEANDLPHMALLQDNGYLLDQLSVQLPSSFLGHTQSTETILTSFCPNLKVFNLVQGSFDMESSIQDEMLSSNHQLTFVSMERSLITSSASLYNFSKLYATSLYYLKLDTCSFSTDPAMRTINTINMPFTQFKKLIIVQDYGATTDAVLVSVSEKKSQCTTFYYYMAQAQELVPIAPSVLQEYHFEKPPVLLDIVCYSLDQLQLNTCHHVLLK
ncbi:hypothetical protein FB192DRAFT_1462941 [Mucor lusitanicus]|uniref:F-box domain-containing protein n=2 Tax=Mucor circinelloides f. lusitanicus TaxID=29924 RepID=A0A168HHZ7_MUCCL|nr:hypothetical protein FB192DRAFT_1462941 [Mucor lusitanicus]OAC98807.1 hypothetical protein MUCCIDRAFT_115051 [Mucor lusitanicus CBS 277.49]